MAEQPASEFSKMIAGELYDASDPQLCEMRLTARRLTREYNNSREDESEKRKEILRDLFGSIGTEITVEPSFRCDYGSNIYVGENFYMNFNCVILDVAPVTMGNNVFIAPNVQIYTATHPITAKERISGLELGKAITIGDNVWLGGNCVICPGVTIGNNAVVGAGAVVVKDVPCNVVVAGNPAKIIKQIDQPENISTDDP
uniref:Maltose/galactoside acetyltransferase domain-containing protein n=1 Tax=Vannella robusta TaxID=1487602 RepID=A0A7S4HVL1_9EUKA|mmetsp:Transcript_16305/g.20851  ORF Transcript_16305/g.20851 Transcript_16305/m.20851 type:complete len:200 (+) Transcript_16305:348-947(+)